MQMMITILQFTNTLILIVHSVAVTVVLHSVGNIHSVIVSLFKWVTLSTGVHFKRYCCLQLFID